MPCPARKAGSRLNTAANLPSRRSAPVESDRGAVLALRPARFPGPLAAPDVRVSAHRALRVSCPHRVDQGQGKAKTYRSTLHMGLDELILSLNRSLAGWANYFRHGASKAAFSAVDYFAWVG